MMSDNVDLSGGLTTSGKRPSVRAPAKLSERFLFVVFSALIVPPLLILQAWKTSSERYRHWLLTVFITVYGSTIGIAYDPLGQGPDGVRHLLRMYTHYLDLEFFDFSRELFEILLFQRGTSPHADVYAHVLSYLVGGVMGMPTLFFPVVAFVYGYFFSGSLIRIFRGLRGAQLPVLVLFIFFNFFLMKNLEGVNTVRTWTGLWVLVYACLHYHETGKSRYLILMAAPPFIHFGYFIMAIPAYVVVLLGVRTTLFSVLFVISSFTTFVNPGSFTEVISQTELGEQRVRAYQRDNVAGTATIIAQSSAANHRIWRVLQRAGVQKWALNIFAYTLLIAGIYRLSMTVFEQRILSIGLLTLALSNSIWFLYAVSNRSWVVGAIFVFAAFALMRIRVGRGFRAPLSASLYRFGLLSSAVLFIPFVAYNLSALLDFPSVFLLVMPFVVWLQPEINMTFKEGLQFILMIRR